MINERKQMRKIAIVCLSVALSVLSTVGVASAFRVGEGSLEVDSLRVGAEGVGGVTFFNGTIVNSTMDGEYDNPVTFGDNVRIDGRVFRGEKPGQDDKPFIINDNLDVMGNVKAKEGNFKKLVVNGKEFNSSGTVDLSGIKSDISSLESDVSSLKSKTKTNANDIDANTGYTVINSLDIDLHDGFVDCMDIVTEGWLYMYGDDWQFCRSLWFGASALSGTKDEALADYLVEISTQGRPTK